MPKYKPVEATRPPTWIRVQDDTGQFDHRADLPLPDGQSVVEGYPEHVAEVARAPKAKVEIKADRQALEDLAKSLDVTVGKKGDGELATAIAEVQAAQAAAQPATEAEAALQAAQSPDDASGTGSTETNEAGSPGEGSE